MYDEFISVAIIYYIIIFIEANPCSHVQCVYIDLLL